MKIDDVARFVVLLNAHPPFADRKALLQARVQGMKLDNGKIEFKQDNLNEARQVTTTERRESILFQPNLTSAPAGDLSASQTGQS